jgi:hypothetical protein
VTLHNLYGSLPGCQLFLKQVDAPEAAWQEMDLKEERIESDGETRPRPPGEPEPLEDVPWSATYACACTLGPGPRGLALRLESLVEGVNAVLDDWTLAEVEQ